MTPTDEDRGRPVAARTGADVPAGRIRRASRPRVRPGAHVRAARSSLTARSFRTVPAARTARPATVPLPAGGCGRRAAALRPAASRCG
jgi:hypothetical protein